MSWSVEGRLYHSYADYERAASRQRDRRLRRLTERFSVPPAETSGIESALATAEARRQALHRAANQVRREGEERRRMVEAHGERIRDAFDEVERGERHLLAELDAADRDLDRRIEHLDAERQRQARASAINLEREIEADGRDTARVEDRGRWLLESAREILDGLTPEKLERLGLDRSAVEGLAARAGGATAAERLELARRAYDQSVALGAEAAYREARLASMREVLRAQIAELTADLDFSSAERTDLVGELDRPLRRELERLGERTEQIHHYDGHQARFEDLGRALDALSTRVSDLATQVREFERLEANRLELVRNQLTGKLERLLDERVWIEGVEAGDLGLQPVEVRLRTAGGERVDCSVQLDGSMRLHHYGHADQATCARVARRIAESVSEMVATERAPTLDVAEMAAGVQRTAVADQAVRREREGSAG